MIKKTIIVTAVLMATTVLVFGQSQLDRVKQLLKQKNYAEAVNVCQNYVMSNQRDEEGWTLLARSLQKAGSLDAAEKAAKKAIELEDDYMEAYTILAEVQLEENKWQEAYSTIQTGFNMRSKGEPKYQPLVIVLGWTLLKADSANAALVAGFAARELDPQKAVPYEIIGEAYLKQGQAKMAVDNFEKSCALDTSSLTAMIGLAAAYSKDRRYTEAAKTYTQILERDPKNDEARLALADLLFRAKQYAKCVTILKEYVKGKKACPQEIREMYIEALLRSGQYDEAAKEATDYLKVKPNAGIAFRAIANAQYYNKQYGKAAESFQKLAAVDTMRFDDYKWLGYSYRQIKKDSLAALTWEKALKDTSETVAIRSQLLNEIGSAWMYARSYDRAADYFKRRYELDQTAVSAYINYAICKMQLNKYEEAISALKEAILKNPDSPSAHVNLGYSYFQLKEYDKARDEFEKAIAVVDTAEFRYKLDLADSHRMIGLLIMLEKKTTLAESEKKFESAIVRLKKSLKYKDDVAQTHSLLGKCYQNLNKIDDAIREYRLSLKYDPKNKEVRKDLDNLLKLQ